MSDMKDMRNRKGRKTPWAPPMLKAMRAVLSQEESSDKTPAQRECRALLKEDRGKFFDHMKSLEAFHSAALKKNRERREELNAEPRSSSETAAQLSRQPVDEGHERCLLLVEQLLARYTDGLPSP